MNKPKAEVRYTPQVPRIVFRVEGRPLPPGTSPGIVGILVGHRRAS